MWDKEATEVRTLLFEDVGQERPVGEDEEASIPDDDGEASGDSGGTDSDGLKPETKKSTDETLLRQAVDG